MVLVVNTVHALMTLLGDRARLDEVVGRIACVCGTEFAGRTLLLLLLDTGGEVGVASEGKARFQDHNCHMKAGTAQTSH